MAGPATALDEYSAAAQHAWTHTLALCPHCHRKFLPARLDAHLRECARAKSPAVAQVAAQHRAPRGRLDEAFLSVERAATPPPVPPTAPPSVPHSARASGVPSPRKSSPRPSRAQGGAGGEGGEGGTSKRAARGGKKTARERMTELKELLDDGMVNQEEYDAKRLAILDSI
jgi:hypothetical protein